MCRRAVTAADRTFFDHGDVLHLACQLGLADAADAVSRLLRQRPGHALCLACIASALGITDLEAITAGARLRRLPGFEMRFEACVGCTKRRQVLAAVRGPGETLRQADRLA